MYKYILMTRRARFRSSTAISIAPERDETREKADKGQYSKDEGESGGCGTKPKSQYISFEECGGVRSEGGGQGVSGGEEQG
jgi:hypothetical protein